MLSFCWRFSLAALAPAALALLAVPAGAQVVYTSRALFDAANPSLSSLNFSGIAPIDGFRDFSSTGLGRDGVTFSVGNSSPTLFVISKGFYPHYALDNSDFLQADASDNAKLNIALPSGTTAFGADFGTSENSGSVQITVNGQVLLTGFTTSSTDAGSFFGYDSLVPITSLSFTDQTGTELNINDVQFGQANPVPEASSVVGLGLLLALGTVGLTRHSGKRRRQAA